MTALTVLIPSRGRPQNVAPIIDAWRTTGAPADGAELVFVIDKDDRETWKYQSEINMHSGAVQVSCLIEDEWRPLVPKLNRAALSLATLSDTPLAFMGDDRQKRRTFSF